MLFTYAWASCGIVLIPLPAAEGADSGFEAGIGATAFGLQFGVGLFSGLFCPATTFFYSLAYRSVSGLLSAAATGQVISLDGIAADYFFTRLQVKTKIA